MVEYIKSPIFNKEYIVADNLSVVKDAVCPIDKTPLVAVVEYDFSNYSCLACGTIYPYGEKSEEILGRIAKKTILGIQENLKVKQKNADQEFSKLEKVLDATKKTGVLE